MKLFVFAAMCSLLDGARFAAHAADVWGYEGKYGPDSWEGLCNTGEYQSPIDIVTDDAVKTDLSSLKFTKYDFAFRADVINTGHGIQIVTVGIPIPLKGGSLPYTYYLEQMHFHWGAEHTINGEQDALELHFVHYARQYDNVTYASEFKNGVAVVAVLFEISNEDNDYLEQIIDAVQDVSLINSNVTRRTLASKLIPSLLLPKDHTSYYRYYGSLTTPSCQEAVIWTILSNKLSISVSQIEIFKKVRSFNETLAYNNRPIQKLGHRTVYHHLEGYSSAQNPLPGSFLMFLTVLSILTQI
ncbi:carbonic anhydrase 1 [Athalia rosae]|uniref:carbonic anhydrase 1 n=1 Tax=Athalia rosae TaxID=37344 RepID=UPI0020339B53|nr:carbonic anhydrase 1 [Athalia rosae]